MNFGHWKSDLNLMSDPDRFVSHEAEYQREKNVTFAQNLKPAIVICIEWNFTIDCTKPDDGLSKKGLAFEKKSLTKITDVFIGLAFLP